MNPEELSKFASIKTPKFNFDDLEEMSDMMDSDLDGNHNYKLLDGVKELNNKKSNEQDQHENQSELFRCYIYQRVR